MAKRIVREHSAGLSSPVVLSGRVGPPSAGADAAPGRPTASGGHAEARLRRLAAPEHTSGARPPRVALQGGATRLSTQKVEPRALAPRPLDVAFPVAPGTQPCLDGPPVAAQTRAGQLHGMSHGIVTPVTHAPSTLDNCQHPRRAYNGRGVGRVKGNRYALQLPLDAVDIQTQDSTAPTSKITI